MTTLRRSTPVLQSYFTATCDGLDLDQSWASTHGRQRRFYSGRAWAYIGLVSVVAVGVIVWGYILNLGAGLPPHRPNRSFAVVRVNICAAEHLIKGLWHAFGKWSSEIDDADKVAINAD